MDAGKEDCAVNGCATRASFIGLSWHKFPRTPASRQKWILFCGRGHGWRPLPHSVICSRHFNSASVVKSGETAGAETLTLSAGAVPEFYPSLSYQLPTSSLAISSDGSNSLSGSSAAAGFSAVSVLRGQVENFMDIINEASTAYQRQLDDMRAGKRHLPAAHYSGNKRQKIDTVGASLRDAVRQENTALHGKLEILALKIGELQGKLQESESLWQELPEFVEESGPKPSRGGRQATAGDDDPDYDVREDAADRPKPAVRAKGDRSRLPKAVIDELKEHFQTNPHPKKIEAEEWATKFDVPLKKIWNWFQNYRTFTNQGRTWKVPNGKAPNGS